MADDEQLGILVLADVQSAIDDLKNLFSDNFITFHR